MMEWFEEFGFDENPFSTDPAFSARSSVGLDKSLAELEYHINSGSIIFVDGAEGSGKSVLLQKLFSKLGRRAVRVDRARLRGRHDRQPAGRHQLRHFLQRGVRVGIESHPVRNGGPGLPIHGMVGGVFRYRHLQRVNDDRPQCHRDVHTERADQLHPERLHLRHRQRDFIAEWHQLREHV